MTTLREAAQQALEAMDAGVSVSPKSVLHDRLRVALAQPDRAQRMRDAGYTRRPTLREMAEDEPGWRLSCGCASQHGGRPAEWASTTREGDPATAYGVICERHWHEYEAQHPRREWRGLTDTDIARVFRVVYGGVRFGPSEKEFAIAVESKLKEKNHE